MSEITRPEDIERLMKEFHGGCEAVIAREKARADAALPRALSPSQGGGGVTDEPIFVHRLHPGVKALDHAIRTAQWGRLGSCSPRASLSLMLEWRLQNAREALVGKKLRVYVKTGKRSKQRRLES